jgi:hypothetical protein
MSDKNTRYDVRTRQILAISVSGLGILGTAILGIVIVIRDKTNGAQLVLTGILPLIGTWLGTVLAFYFAKENFEAAADQTKELVRLGQQGTLNSSDPVLKHMMPLGEMAVYAPRPGPTGTPKDLKLAEATKQINDSKFDRLPVLDTGNVFRYILTGSSLNRCIVQKGINLAGADAAYTFEQLFTAEPSLKDRFAKLVAFVPESATLGDAKRAMDAVKGCRDVFVTKTGNPTESVLGWITNNKLLSESEV